MKLRTDSRVDKLKLGLTGWAQINGRDEISQVEKVNLEKEYLLRKSINLDLEIFFKTFFAAFFSKNVKL